MLLWPQADLVSKKENCAGVGGALVSKVLATQA